MLFIGPATKSYHFEVYRPFPRRSLQLATKAEHRRSSYYNLVRGATNLDAPREHLHLLGRYKKTIASRCREVRSNRQGIQANDRGTSEDAKRRASNEQRRPGVFSRCPPKGIGSLRESLGRIFGNEASRVSEILLRFVQRSVGYFVEWKSAGDRGQASDKTIRLHGSIEIR